MNEEQFMQHAEKCCREMESKQKAFEEKYDLAQYPVYWGDENTIVLRTNADNAVKHEFGVVFIGAHTLEDEFTWGWADESLAGIAREKSAAIKELSQISGFSQFETPTIEMDPPNLEKILPVVLDHLNAAGCYINKNKEPFLFIAIIESGY
jgi:hypothetical protein